MSVVLVESVAGGVSVAYNSLLSYVGRHRAAALSGSARYSAYNSLLSYVGGICPRCGSMLRKPAYNSLLSYVRPAHIPQPWPDRWTYNSLLSYV